METETMDLFIVDNDETIISRLKQYLNTRFGGILNITSFTTSESCLENVNRKTRFVVLADFLNGKSGTETLKLIKEKNPTTEVIILSTNDNVGMAIEAYRNGAKDVVVKGQKSRKKIAQHIFNVFTYPINFLVAEFGVSKYLAIFLLAFTTLTLVVLAGLQIFK